MRTSIQELIPYSKVTLCTYLSIYISYQFPYLWLFESLDTSYTGILDYRNYTLVTSDIGKI